MTSPDCHPNIAVGDHKGYMECALEKARLSPPSPTKFCVGAVLVDADRNEILSTGYSMELPGDRPGDPGNTHAEQCCFIKVADQHNVPEAELVEVLPRNTVLYTTMDHAAGGWVATELACKGYWDWSAHSRSCMWESQSRRRLSLITLEERYWKMRASRLYAWREWKTVF